MNGEISRTDPSPNRTFAPAVCSAYISSVWPNGWFGAWMMTCGWSCVSGPLWAPTRHPAPLFSDGHGRRSRRGGVTAPGTTPTHVLLLNDDVCSPRKIVLDTPSVTIATVTRELR